MPARIERNTMDMRSRCATIPFVDAQQLWGREVEIELDGRIIDRGVVDCSTADGSVLWLKQDAINHRRLIQRSAGLRIRVCAPDAAIHV